MNPINSDNERRQCLTNAARAAWRATPSRSLGAPAGCV